ncbi:MAG TPA: ribbon-helix-helix protein, CopG family [Bryobacteraceae bacterium]|jgi:metal-responsive CopG/Arc/MetJ family transcriptional regulator
MPSVLIQLDDATAKKLERIAPARKRKRAEFIREAVKEAIRNHEFARMREAYRLQPDSAEEADDWSSAEEFKA